jgi:hypothetical protein
MTRSLALRLSQVAVLVSLGSALVVNTARAQEQPVSPLTEQHELLKKDVGTWDTAGKIWPGPGAAPIVSQGRETYELLPGGLWLVSRFEGTTAGMPFAAVGTWGYDPAEKKYVGTWVDSMTPQIMTFKGDYDPQTKTMTRMSDRRNPATGATIKFKTITRYVDDDTRLFEMYLILPDGQPWKTMEIEYKRAAK